MSVAARRRTTYGEAMGRIVLAVVGVLLALFLVFGVIIPAVLGLLKLVLIVGVIGVLLFAGVTLYGKLTK
ncbi:hypothetical protein Misp01_49550 [Microtetraspora sp. NBRC 13810]|nr:hypothetical protein Misp01_49550 [Microtetraspora sp. NBRC 13810]